MEQQGDLLGLRRWSGGLVDPSRPPGGNEEEKRWSGGPKGDLLMRLRMWSGVVDPRRPEGPLTGARRSVQGCTVVWSTATVCLVLGAGSRAEHAQFQVC